MANFLDALKYTLREEGGYVNHPSDPGGATNMGISLRFLTGLKGVKDTYDFDSDGNLIEPIGDLNNDGKVDGKDIRSISMNYAGRIYKFYFWDKIKLDKLASQIIANQLFDISVNSGPVSAKKFLLDTLKVNNIQVNTLDEAYAVISNLTSERIIKINNELVEARKAFYKRLNKPMFLKGWLLRASRFYVGSHA